MGLTVVDMARRTMLSLCGVRTMPINSFDDYPMTWRPTLDRSGRALYRTLAARLEADIRGGALRPGTRLPPQRELADFLDVNVSTVSKAFKQCELKGLLSATVGSGTFVSYDALTNGRLISVAHGGLTADLGATVPEPSGNAALLEMARTILAEPDAEELFSYRALRRDDWQRDAARLLFCRCGFDARPEQILPAPGGQNALTAVLAACFRRGDRIAVDDHTYPGVKTAAAMLGIRLVPVSMDDAGMDPVALEAACRNEPIAGIYCIPACHNPTTITMPAARRDALARIAETYGCLVVEDGTYQLLAAGERAIADRIPARSIYFISLSKAISPGLRMAYLAAPPDYDAAISDALYSLNVTVAPLMAEIAARIVGSGRFEEIAAEHRRRTAARNAIVSRHLSEARCRGGGTDIFRWLLLPEHLTGEAFERLALERGVQVYAAGRFAVGKTVPLRAARLSICAPPDPKTLERGVRILAELLAE